MDKFVISTFYKIMELPNFTDFKAPLISLCKKIGVKGTILITPEGLNGTVAGISDNINAFYKAFYDINEFADITFLEMHSEYMPFQKVKILLKGEVVKMEDQIRQSNMAEGRGEYLSPEEWDKMLKTQSQSKRVIIDTRNNFEVLFGAFVNAINPKTETFSQFPEWAEENLNNLDRDTEVMMYCTGGIRCEKSTAYVLKMGFEKVYHLEHGILNYLKKTKNKNKLWRGSCFVFDDRLALDDELKPIEDDMAM